MLAIVGEAGAGDPAELSAHVAWFLGRKLVEPGASGKIPDDGELLGLAGFFRVGIQVAIPARGFDPVCVGGVEALRSRDVLRALDVGVDFGRGAARDHEPLKDHSADVVRLAQIEVDRDPGAGVSAPDDGVSEPLCIEVGLNIVGVLFVTVRARLVLIPAMAAQVERMDAVAVAEMRYLAIE